MLRVDEHSNIFAECLTKNIRQRVVCLQNGGRVNYSDGGTRQNFCRCVSRFAECPWHSANRLFPVVFSLCVQAHTHLCANCFCLKHSFLELIYSLTYFTTKKTSISWRGNHLTTNKTSISWQGNHLLIKN